MKENTIRTLLEKYPTPFYTFESRVLRERVKYLKSVLPAEAELCYAVKANTFISPVIADLADRFEICSPGELAICTEQGIEPEKMVISGVYKAQEDIAPHIASEQCAGYYTAESARQFALLKESAENARKRIRVLLRLTSGNQFGMNEEDILQIFSGEKNNKQIDLCGIQFFSTTQKTSLKKTKRELEHLADFARKITEITGVSVKQVEYGTGFPVNYFDGGEFEEDTYLSDFSLLIENFNYPCKIILEIGRSIVASCGSYFTKAVDTKINKDCRYAIMDGGIHHISYFGQFMAMKHPYIDVYPQREGEEHEWTLCGSLCTVNDILVKALPLKEFKCGDTVIFKNAGAYCSSEGISLFLSRALPAVILLDENESDTLLRNHFNTYKLNH